MTLLIVWRSQEGVHLLSDSRLTLGDKSVDLGIKIMSAPYRIRGAGPDERQVAKGDLGLGFAGSAIAALTLTATLRDVLMTMQGEPPYSDTSMTGVADLLWRAYDLQQKTLCGVMDAPGEAAVVVTGYCGVSNRPRTFLFDVDPDHRRRRQEILAAVGDFHILGSGSGAARSLLPDQPGRRDVFLAVQTVIEDESVPTVGGALQYGELVAEDFRTLGVARRGERGIHYWRGGLDLNGPDLTRTNGLVFGYSHLDLINF